ncbi:retrovirus-related pol polyprotein from transposon TNT 1-94 [Tanacetum coccineum]
MKTILRKDKCLAAIGERLAEVTDDSKWDEMDGNAIANIHLALADGVLSSIEEKKVQRRFGIIFLDYSQERAEILLQSLPDSYDQVIINLTSNVLSDYLVFDDVSAAILEEENRRNNREDKQTSKTGEGFVVKEREVNGIWLSRCSTSREMSIALQKMVTLCVVKQRLQMKAGRDLQTYGFAMIMTKTIEIVYHGEDDDCLRCKVYPIKKKSDVFEVFKVYKARVELDSGKNIKCLRTDNGGEYIGDEFDTFFRQEGIKRQFTTAYTPQQNEVAERMNRTLLVRARACWRLKLRKFVLGGRLIPCYVINRFTLTAVENYKVGSKNPEMLVLGDKIQEIKEGDSTTRETTSIQMENEFQSNDSSEAAPQHEENEINESQDPATRTLNHKRRRPGWQSDYVMESNIAYCLLTEEGEPSTLQEALNNPDASFWKEAMQEEIEALHKNKTWELVPLPGGRKPIGNKWVYKIKRNGDDQVERYRARLVVKGYAQKEGIDFNEIFSPVVRMTTVRVVLAMCATYDLHLEQLDVKTAFLHGNLEEEIYMLQPEGFKQKGKENLVCRLNKSLYGLKQVPRPAHAVRVVSRYMTEPGRAHWKAVKRILRYIKGTSDVALCFGESDLVVKGYVHSDYAGDLDESKSTTGYVFTLSGGTVSWVSKLQSVVAMSTTKAEYVAAA